MGRIFICSWTLGTLLVFFWMETFGQRVVYDAHSNVEAKLSFVILNGDWFWTPTRSEALVVIQSRLSELNLSMHDKAIWTASKKRCYFSLDTWQILRKKKIEIEWEKLVWFPLAIPKQAFILWLVMKDMLLIGDHLIKMGYKR
jgi:hypothetical protein